MDQQEKEDAKRKGEIYAIAYTPVEHNTTTFSVRWPRANAKSKIVPKTNEIDATYHSGNGVILIFIFSSFKSNRCWKSFHFLSLDFKRSYLQFFISCVSCHRKVFCPQNSSARIPNQFGDKKKLFSTINSAKIIFSI